MKTYPSYTSTALPWVTEVPSHWKLARNKNIFQEVKDTVGERADDYPLLSLTKKGIILRDVSSGKGKFPKDFGTYKVVNEGDMAFCLFDIDETPRTVGLSGYKGMLTGAYTIFHVTNINPRYAYYYYLSVDDVKALRPLYSGLRKTINTETFLSTKLPVPPRAEQDQIVHFLDWKVSSIHRLVNIRKRQIEQLEELKKAVISRVADRYNKIPFQYCAWIRARLGWRGLKAHEYVDVGYPFLSAFNIVNNKLSWENLNYITKERYDESPEIKLSIGDILLVKDGAGIGKCARIDCLPCGESTTNGSLAVITPYEKLHYRFLYYYLVSNEFKNAANIILTGMGVPHLTQHFLKNTEIPIPSLDEQIRISDILDAKCNELDMLINKIKKQIDALHELKTRLISDVVTGQLDVRGIAIPAYEYTEEATDSGAEDTETEEMSEEADGNA